MGVGGCLSDNLGVVSTDPRSGISAQVVSLCVCLCMCVSSFSPRVWFQPSAFACCVFFFCVFVSVGALGFWVLLPRQLLCDLDQAQQMLRPPFNAAMSAP